MKQLILEMQDMAGGLRGRERGDIFSHLDIGLFKSIVKFLYNNFLVNAIVTMPNKFASLEAMF